MTLRLFVIRSSLLLNLLALSPSRVCGANPSPITPENRAVELLAWRQSVTYTLRCMAMAHADRNALEEALGYALIIPDPAESGRTLGEIAFKQARRGDVEGALRWIEQAELPAHKAFALSEVARALMAFDEN